MAMTKKLSVILCELLRSEFKHSSPNLKKYASSKKIKSLEHYIRIYKDSDRILHIGFIDDTNCFIGRRLLKIASGDFQSYAYGINGAEDVTQWFIDEYKKKGMCAYAGDWRHEWNVDENPQLEDGTVRTCIHCGKQETLKSKMVKKTWWE